MSRHLMQVLYSFHQAGSETIAKDIAVRLDPKRIRSSACALDVGGPMESDFACAGIPTYVMHRRPGFDWRLMIRLHRLFRRQRVDIVQTHHLTQLIYAGLAARLASAKLIHVEHEYFTLKSNVARRRLRLLATLCQKIVAVSPEVGQFLYATLGPRDVVVICNGIDLAAYRPIIQTPNCAPKVLGHVARLDRAKDQATLLRAFRLVLDTRPDAQLVMVGEGPMRDELTALARHLGVEKGVEFLGLRRDVPHLLHTFDVFVLSSIEEGLPLALLEAMASGLPVVATEVGSVSQVVRHGVTGFVVAPRDPASLGQQVLALMGDRHLMQSMGSAGRKTVEERFSLSSTVRAYEALYDSVT